MDPISRYADFADTVPVDPALPTEPGAALRRPRRMATGPRRRPLPPLLGLAARWCSAIGAVLVTVLLVLSQFELAADYGRTRLAVPDGPALLRAVQGADLVAVGVAKIGQVQLAG